MLFHSLLFLLGFLPAALLAERIARRTPHTTKLVLVAVSLVFYGWWDYRFVPLLVGSIAFNWLAGILLLRASTSTSKNVVASIAITANIALLVFFKYAAFLVEAVASAVGTSHADGAPSFASSIPLPLAISFLTFHQVALIADIRRGDVRSVRLLDCALFASFFPHLIAGPIVRYNEIVPQFERHHLRAPRHRQEDFELGLRLLAIGLCKKLLIADQLAAVSEPAFIGIANGAPPTFFEAWLATAAFGLRIYFDFSAYSDMALGLACMFGVRFPANFLSPYAALNIREFWRRWHISLSRFLRDYVYIPLGGNRLGEARTAANLLLTMLVGGVWHGASWTFAVWGLMHGGYLVTHRVWHRLVPDTGPSRFAGRAVARTVTLLAVLIAWVPFRADSIGDAFGIWKAMFLFEGIAIPYGGIDQIGMFHRLLADLGVALRDDLLYWPTWSGLAVFTLAGAIAIAGSNSIEIVGSNAALPVERSVSERRSRMVETLRAFGAGWGLAIVYGVALFAAFVAALAILVPNEFLYFQF